MKSTGNFARTALALLAGAAFVAGALPAQAQGNRIEIQWWHAMGGALGERVNEMAENFNKGQDKYTVVAVNKGNYAETLTAAMAAFRAGKGPHIVQVFEVGTGTMMAARGAIKPVYQLMAENGYSFDPKTYLAAVTGYYTTTDGKMLSFPFNSSTPVFYYNKDAFKKAGLDPAKPPKTWQEVDAALPKLKAAGYSCPFTTSWQSWVQLENFSAMHNVPFASKANGFGGLDAELKFNGPLQVRHIENLGKWAKDGLFIYAGRKNEPGGKFIAGECAILMESSAGYANVKRGAKFDWGISMQPYYADVKGAPQNSIIGGASLWVLAKHKPAEYKGVAEFMDFLSATENQVRWHTGTGYLPITPMAYETTKLQGFYNANPGTDISVQQMNLNPPTENSKGLRLGNFVQIRDVIDEELEGVWSGKKSAKEALDTAVERGNKLLRQFERDNKRS
ncbi:sn-glycerol-3-phosphate ABC transporter substrate-binding protein UgpB [Ferrovibrio sp.]|uniref:sn-glycerol-3-phosphate ABC transporter substrate-binding protein UgpB n=1 Tax=Ferrovibrio sp. TaxID=1917215 RepID=UPI00311FABF8